MAESKVARYTKYLAKARANVVRYQTVLRKLTVKKPVAQAKS